MKTLDMLKKAGSMRKEMKNIQKSLAKQTAEGSAGGVTVVACGDMSLAELRIDPSQIDVSNTELLQKRIMSAVNDALSSVKKNTAAEISKAAGGLSGLADLIG